MNMLFRRTSRLIAAGALTLIVPTLASAADVARVKSFKLAMGPMSAAQKNQNQGMAEKSAEAEIKQHHHIKHRRRHHVG